MLLTNYIYEFKGTKKISEKALQRINNNIRCYVSVAQQSSPLVDKNSLLILSPFLYPEKTSSAAGVRTYGLLDYFSNNKKSNFSHVYFGCGLKKKEHDQSLLPQGVTKCYIPPNRSIMKDILSCERIIDNNTIVSKEKRITGLSTVIFDRYFAEEAYSFHFFQHETEKNGQNISPILRVLDLQDVHFLRKHRQELVSSWDKNNFEGSMLSEDLMEKVVSFTPKSSSNNSLLLRELASIHRSDLVLVCSPFEVELLVNEYKIDPKKLVLASFFVNSSAEEKSTTHKTYNERSDFICVGGFKHPPNIDQVQVLKHEIWPQIRHNFLNESKNGFNLPSLYVYGSYPPTHISKLHIPKDGFIVKGFAADIDQVLNDARVLLAPIRFGAGIKGKIVDAFRCGCPVVTTPIGSEGMLVNNDVSSWGGLIASNSRDFSQKAFQLYTNKEKWNDCHKNSQHVLKSLYSKKRNLDQIQSAIIDAILSLDERRDDDHVSNILWHQSMRSTEYFSKWIQLKETGQSSDV